MQDLTASILGLLVLSAIVGTAIYVRKSYEELVKLNQKIDELIERKQ